MKGTFVVLKQKKILGNICFSEQIFYRKQSLGASGILKLLTHHAPRYICHFIL